MTDAELRDRMKASIKGWEETGELLEMERYERVRNANTVKSEAVLGGMVDLAVRADFHPNPCGLIEFYEILSRGKS